MEKHEIRNLVRGGQVTLPKWFRDKYHLSTGDPLEFIAEEGRLVIKPAINLAKATAVRKLIKFLDEAGDIAPSMTEKEVISQARKEIKKVRSSDENSH